MGFVMDAHVREEETSAKPTRWLSLKEASRFLGVNGSTLRRWADAGYVRAFRTMGGHRRFSEDDLKSLVGGQLGGRWGASQELGTIVAVRIQRRLRRGKTVAAEWYNRLAGPMREELRSLGRRLTDLLGQFIERRSQGGRLLKEAREVGYQYAHQLKEAGLSLKDVVAAFVFFRQGLEDAAAEVARRHNLGADEVSQLWDFVSDLGDQVLLAIGEAYSP